LETWKPKQQDEMKGCGANKTTVQSCCRDREGRGMVPRGIGISTRLLHGVHLHADHTAAAQEDHLLACDNFDINVHLSQDTI
jgi:hypothetical protein